MTKNSRLKQTSIQTASAYKYICTAFVNHEKYDWIKVEIPHLNKCMASL